MSMLDNPRSYAKHLATYIKAPTKIEKLVEVEFGKGRAPSLFDIARMRLHVERRDRFARNVRKEVVNIERAVAREERRKREIEAANRQAIEALPTVPTEPAGNPFLRPWALTGGLARSVAEDFGVGAAEILGRGRRTALVNARSVVIKLMVDRGLGFAEVGRRMGRDHSTIIHRYRKFESDFRRCAIVRDSYERHLKLIAEAAPVLEEAA